MDYPERERETSFICFLRFLFPPDISGFMIPYLSSRNGSQYYLILSCYTYLMATREERLKATQKAYAEWSEKTDFITENEASDEDEAKFIEKLIEVDPQLKENFSE